MKQYTTILIIDFGSSYTQLLARKIRELGMYSAILPCTATAKAIQDAQPSAIILCGDPESVSLPDAPPFNQIILELGVPVLGICYGMQVLAKALGAGLTPADIPYTAESVQLSASPLWKNCPATITALNACGDTITTLPDGCVTCASTPTMPIAAFAHEERRLYGMQFHPEEPRTEHGMDILTNFLVEICKLPQDWDMKSFIDRIVNQTRTQVGDKNVVLGLSGGIDSTVVAALLHKAIGKQLYCIFVDQGLMRKDEPKQVAEMLNKHLPGLNLICVDASETFLGRLKGVEDPEQKRKIIGHTFIEVFDEEAHKISNVAFLAQGTVYPDIIESYTPRGKVIKSHHNVGGLPETMKMELVEPLRDLFKDEVRAVGKELGLPDDVIWRHPFPGPGLAVRVLGEVTPERVKVLQEADAIVTEELKASGWYRKVWQGFAVLLPLKTVGVSRSTRTYDHVIALRMVDSIDAMSATWSRLPHDLLETISHRICSEVAGISRVVLDISSKPPSTIEWE